MGNVAEMRVNVAEMRVIVGDREESGREETQRAEELRILEALLFAAEEPLDEKTLASRLPEGTDVHALLTQLQQDYAPRGVNLVRVAGKWTLRTAGDLAWLLTRESVVPRKLSRAAIETLAIVAYHQPVTRAEIEDIRGVTTSKGTLDVLLEMASAGVTRFGATATAAILDDLAHRQQHGTPLQADTAPAGY